MSRLRFGRRSGVLICLLGDGAGSIRHGATEWVYIRLFAADAGALTVAYLPRFATSSSLLTLADEYLPAEGTQLFAEPFATSGPGLGMFRIDLASLPATVTTA